MMKVTSWGKYPTIDSKLLSPMSVKDVTMILSDKSEKKMIARGLGRSYGDSSLAPYMLRTAYLNHFSKFDGEKGYLTCFAGVSLAEILEVFVPKGWFLAVTPGTKYITIGGAIASDVHGKNHHLVGCFSDHVISMKIATVAEGVVECSKVLNSELFYATCGGMGLTGIILEATIKLISIKSAYINETIIRTKNLEEVLALFETNHSATYSVAWIDCLATGKHFGRSLLMFGEHSENGDLQIGKDRRIAIPLDMPGVINQWSIQVFNALYYYRLNKKHSRRFVHYESFFYPLDTIHQWNRIYGRNGFAQYQLAIPKAAGISGIRSILKRIVDSKRGSFLAVLKVFGKGNSNYLSFPIEGYTLALDFKINNELFSLLNELDKTVLQFGGRLYMTKDVRMSEETLKLSYPHWYEFVDVRSKYQADKVFHSLQSCRLGL